jgi:hypothetical protein
MKVYTKILKIWNKHLFHFICVTLLYKIYNLCLCLFLFIFFKVNIVFNKKYLYLEGMDPRSVENIFKEKTYFSFSIQNQNNTLSLFSTDEYQTDTNVILCVFYFYKAFLLTNPKIDPVLSSVHNLSHKSIDDTDKSLYKTTLYLMRNLIEFNGNERIHYIKFNNYTWILQWLQGLYLNSIAFDQIPIRIEDLKKIKDKPILELNDVNQWKTLPFFMYKRFCLIFITTILLLKEEKGTLLDWNNLAGVRYSLRDRSTNRFSPQTESASAIISQYWIENENDNEIQNTTEYIMNQSTDIQLLFNGMVKSIEEINTMLNEIIQRLEKFETMLIIPVKNLIELIKNIRSSIEFKDNLVNKELLINKLKKVKNHLLEYDGCIRYIFTIYNEYFEVPLEVSSYILFINLYRNSNLRKAWKLF